MFSFQIILWRTGRTDAETIAADCETVVELCATLCRNGPIG